MEHPGTPDEPDRPAESGILDPRDARSRHQARTGPTAGLQYLRVITAQEQDWMNRMVARTARAHRVDGEELMQELLLGLLTCDSIDAGRREVRGWLKRRAQWRAADLLRQNRLRRERDRSTDDVAPTDPIAPEPTGPEPCWNVDRLGGLSLSRDGSCSRTRRTRAIGAASRPVIRMGPVNGQEWTRPPLPFAR